ncbi:MAG: alpha/beta fold hydrolase [Planctomycetes bacterium]|nr:alpha/beta fold hydrolase [Planctomycetota bacterium]
MSKRLLGIGLGTLLAACSSVQDNLSKQSLTPPDYWLTEPADFGLAAEPFEVVLHSEASFTGYWIPNPEAGGRTVVLFHGGDTNVGSLHPWYRALHDAGFSVLAFDPRGFGRSKGTPTLRSWIYDLPELFDWLRARPDVDKSKIAFYGTGLGSVAAMWAAKSQRDCVAMVLEGLPSLREQLRENVDDGSALGAYTLAFSEFAGLPEDFEAADNAPLVKTPALFISGALEPARDRRALLTAFDQFGGPRELWVLPETGAAPHGMSTHDGEYQRTIAAYLQRQFEHSAQHLAADWHKVTTSSTGTNFYEVKIAAQPEQPKEPIAVEAAVISGDEVHFATTWLEGKDAAVRLQLGAAPTHIGVSRILDAVAADDGTARRQLTPLARATRAIDPIFPSIETVRFGQPTADECRKVLDQLIAAEHQAPFPPVIEAELADIFARIGMTLAESKDATERQTAQALLQRALAAVPEHPERHFWAGPRTTYGFPQQATIDAARRVVVRQ